MLFKITHPKKRQIPYGLIEAPSGKEAIKQYIDKNRIKLSHICLYELGAKEMIENPWWELGEEEVYIPNYIPNIVQELNVEYEVH